MIVRFFAAIASHMPKKKYSSALCAKLVTISTFFCFIQSSQLDNAENLLEDYFNENLRETHVILKKAKNHLKARNYTAACECYYSALSLQVPADKEPTLHNDIFLQLGEILLFNQHDSSKACAVFAKTDRPLALLYLWFFSNNPDYYGQQLKDACAFSDSGNMHGYLDLVACLDIHDIAQHRETLKRFFIEVDQCSYNSLAFAKAYILFHRSIFLDN